VGFGLLASFPVAASTKMIALHILENFNLTIDAATLSAFIAAMAIIRR
jgi:hypothetical protein